MAYPNRAALPLPLSQYNFDGHNSALYDFSLVVKSVKWARVQCATTRVSLRTISHSLNTASNFIEQGSRLGEMEVYLLYLSNMDYIVSNVFLPYLYYPAWISLISGYKSTYSCLATVFNYDCIRCYQKIIYIHTHSTRGIIIPYRWQTCWTSTVYYPDAIETMHFIAKWFIEPYSMK